MHMMDSAPLRSAVGLLSVTAGPALNRFFKTEACLSWKDDMQISTKQHSRTCTLSCCADDNAVRQRLRRRLNVVDENGVGVQLEDGLRECRLAHTLSTRAT